MPMTDRSSRPYQEFGAWLRSRRLARRWTQEELARRLAYDVSYIRKIEWGERRPSEALRVRVCQVLGVPVSSLPGAAGAVPAGGVPTAEGPLIGRDEAVSTALWLFQRGARLVTIVGAPGIGKTRLALAVATHFDEELAVGVRFVPLVEVSDPAGVGPAIGQALGITEPRSHDQGAERLLDALRTQDTLLVLDNFEQVMPAASLVAELLAGVPTLRILVTSRQVLDLRLECHFSLPPLAVPEGGDDDPDELARVVPSVALFLARARKARPDFTLDVANAADVAQICTRLQGIPMAIELAAASIRLLTPKALLAELGAGLDLPLPGPRDTPEHQRTVRAAIAWSYDLLPPAEKVLLGRLAVFVGGCTLASAAAVCRLPDDEQLDQAPGVLDLAAKSLVEPVHDGIGGTRFVTLEAVRSFALECLAGAGELQLLQRRHAAWCLELARVQGTRLKGGQQGEALAVLAAEHANLRAALQWSVAHDPDGAGQLCLALWRYWWIRGHLAEAGQWLAAVGAGPHPDAAARAELQVVAGVLARTQGSYDRAAELLGEGAALAGAVDNRPALALALVNLGNVAGARQCYERANTLFEASRQIYEALGDLRGVGHSVNGLGTMCLAADQLEPAAALFEEALALFRAIDDDWSTALVLGNLGWVAYRQGRTESARRLYHQAATVYRRLGDERGVADTLLNLGLAVHAEAGGEGGEGMFQEALLSYARLGERRGVGECLSALALVRQVDHPEAAAMFLGAAHGLRKSIGAPLRPADQAIQAGVQEALRKTLGDAGFDAAWCDGLFLRPEEVVALALAAREDASAIGGRA